jgi:hypothetical protein
MAPPKKTKPKKFSRRILIPVDDMIWNELESIRQFEGISVAESVRRAIRAYLNLPAEPPKKDA